jgi:hypothetical protein
MRRGISAAPHVNLACAGRANWNAFDVVVHRTALDYQAHSDLQAAAYAALA